MKSKYKMTMAILVCFIFSPHPSEAMKNEIIKQTSSTKKRSASTVAPKSKKVRKVLQKTSGQVIHPRSVSVASLGTSQEVPIYIDDSTTDEEASIENDQLMLNKVKQEEGPIPFNPEETSNEVRPLNEGKQKETLTPFNPEETSNEVQPLNEGKQKETLTPFNPEETSNEVQPLNEGKQKETLTPFNPEETSNEVQPLNKGKQKETLTPSITKEVPRPVHQQVDKFQQPLRAAHPASYNVLVTTLGDVPLAQCIVDSDSNIKSIRIYRTSPETKEERKNYPYGVFYDEIFTHAKEVFSVKPSRIIPRFVSVKQFEDSFVADRNKQLNTAIFNSPFKEPIFLREFVQSVIRPYNFTQEFGTVATIASPSVIRMVNSTGAYIGSLTLPKDSIVKYIKVFHIECLTDEEREMYPQGIFEDEITTSDQKVRIIRPSRIVPHHISVKDYLASFLVRREMLEQDI